MEEKKYFGDDPVFLADVEEKKYFGEDPSFLAGRSDMAPIYYNFVESLRLKWLKDKNNFGDDPYGLSVKLTKNDIENLFLVFVAEKKTFEPIVFQECQDFKEQEETERRSIPPVANLSYLKTVLKKNGISWPDFEPARLRSLANALKEYKRHAKNVNYVCFLYFYFKKLPDSWPKKEEIIEKLAKNLTKSEKTKKAAEKSFQDWWERVPSV